MQKPPGFDDLIARVRAGAGALPDPRTGDNTQFAMADIALAAYLHFENWSRLMDFMMRGLEIGPHALVKN